MANTLSPVIPPERPAGSWSLLSADYLMESMPLCSHRLQVTQVRRK